MLVYPAYLNNVPFRSYQQGLLFSNGLALSPDDHCWTSSVAMTRRPWSHCVVSEVSRLQRLGKIVRMRSWRRLHKSHRKHWRRESPLTTCIRRYKHHVDRHLYRYLSRTRPPSSSFLRLGRTAHVLGMTKSLADHDSPHTNSSRRPRRDEFAARLGDDVRDAIAMAFPEGGDLIQLETSRDDVSNQQQSHVSPRAVRQCCGTVWMILSAEHARRLGGSFQFLDPRMPSRTHYSARQLKILA